MFFKKHSSDEEWFIDRKQHNGAWQRHWLADPNPVQKKMLGSFIFTKFIVTLLFKWASVILDEFTVTVKYPAFIPHICSLSIFEGSLRKICILADIKYCNYCDKKQVSVRLDKKLSWLLISSFSHCSRKYVKQFAGSKCDDTLLSFVFYDDSKTFGFGLLVRTNRQSTDVTLCSGKL